MFYEDKNWPEFIKLKKKIKQAGLIKSEEFRQKQVLDHFYHEYAKILWGHTRLMQPGAKKSLTDELKDCKKDILKENKQYLKSWGYSKRTINSTLTLLKKDLDKQIEKYLNTKGEVYPEKNPEKRPWLVQENYTISKIMSLFEEFTELSEIQIQSSMALVFEKIDFWPHERNITNEERVDRYVERLKKRYQKIKKRPFAFELDENSKENLL